MKKYIKINQHVTKKKNQWVNDEIKEEIRKYLEKAGNTTSQIYGMQQKYF